MQKQEKIDQQLKQVVLKAISELYGSLDLTVDEISLEHPVAPGHGDYATNVALVISKNVSKPPLVIAKEIVERIRENGSKSVLFDQVEVAPPGFVNFVLKKEVLVGELGKIREIGKDYGSNQTVSGKKIMVEFAHPNTHKELHIGHMRTLTTGEALARVLQAGGAEVFRANYQGDIGPHVAKAMWGIQLIMKREHLQLSDVMTWANKDKAHLLGRGYIEGNEAYERGEMKNEIDLMNSLIYQRSASKEVVSSFRDEEQEKIWNLYQVTRDWSLAYYAELYTRFYTKFDSLYFESEVAQPGKGIVEANIGKVFEKNEGAIIFDGEKYGLHKRVFVTKDGNPTYEAKDMALAPLQYADFPFDLIIHVVANEQAGYFQVIIKALELLDPKFVGRQFHLSMGMVQLVGRKISSRTGELVTVDGLLDEVKDLLRPLVHSDLETAEKEEVLEAATIGAVKYSVLKSSPLLNSTFDLGKSVSLDGDSGPYLQYTYARARSVLRKAGEIVDKGQKIINLSPEEVAILRYLYRFPEVVEAAARTFSPNLICSYLFELAKRFNNFYNSVPILQAENEDLIGFRLGLTEATSIVVKNGLSLLGIKALERM